VPPAGRGPAAKRKPARAELKPDGPAEAGNEPIRTGTRAGRLDLSRTGRGSRKPAQRAVLFLFFISFDP
jgi:hypothetical protein